MLQSFGWVPAASCPPGDYSPLVAKDMVGELLVVGACTCCCTLVVLGPVDFGRIDSSARLLRRHFVPQTVLELVPEPGPGLELPEHVAC